MKQRVGLVFLLCSAWGSAETTQEWLKRLSVAKEPEKHRLLLGYRTLTDHPRAALPVLLAALKDGQPEVRRAAIAALGESESTVPAVVQSLVDALHDRDLTCGLYAAAALLKVPSELTFKPLLALLADKSEMLRDNRHQNVTGGVIKTWRLPPLAAAYMLGRTPSAAPQLAILALTKPLKEDSTGSTLKPSRAYAIMALRRLDVAAIGPLVAALSRPELDRLKALSLLEPFLSRPEVTRALPQVAALLWSRDLDLATAAAGFLEKSGPEGLRRLNVAARLGNPYAHRAQLSPRPLLVPVEIAPTAIKPFRPQPQVDANASSVSRYVLMTAALLDRSFEVRADAIKTLWQYNTPVNVVNEEQVRSVCSALGLALDSEDIQVRNAAMHAIRLLGKAGSVILKKVQQRAREMAGTASARIAFDSLIALGPDSNSKKLLVDIASKGSRRVAPVESIDVDLAVRLAELPQQQWGEPDAVIVDSIAAAFERGDWLLDRADMKVLFESGQRGSQHVIRFALNSPYSLKCLALRTLGRAGVAEHTLILYKALVNDEDKSVAGCAADGLKASLEQAVTLQNSPHQVLLKAGVEPRLLVGWLKRVPNWGASSDTAVELLALLDETPETVAAFAVRHLRQNKYFRRPTILANDSEFAAAFTLSLFEVLDTKQVEPHVFELLRAYPEQVRQAVPRIITAAREATPEGRLEAMRLLLATSPADPSVIDYLRRCAFDEDLTLSYEASWTLYKRGYKEIAVQLHAIAVKQIEAGAEKDGFATVTELAWPLNKLDPLIEVTAIERYLERLFRSLIEDDTFEGELRTPSPATHAPTAAENASDNWNLPRFSWPPPEYSERDNITDLFGNAGDISLGTIDNHIQSALRLKGYGVGGLYRIKGGFLRAAKLEQLSQERQQVPSKYRFLTAPIPPQSLVDYLGQLFLARSGIFRLILFAVTSAPVVGDETTQITIEQARTTFLHGDPGQLPTDVQTMQLGRRRVYVLIYEFEKKMGRSRQVIPSPLMARDHLVKAGLLELLSRRAK